MSVRPRLFAVYQQQDGTWKRVSEISTEIRTNKKYGGFVSRSPNCKLDIRRANGEPIVPLLTPEELADASVS